MLEISNWALERDEEILDALSQIAEHPSWNTLVDQVKDGREEYFRKLARQISSSAQPLDQRVIDEKRGFWQGALWAVYSFPHMNKKQWDTFIERQLKEAEQLGD